jgi:nucleoid DNA-binding protein
MTKADLVEQVYEAIGPGITKKDCGAVVDAFLNAIKQALADGEHIEIRGFGTFKVRQRRSRMARNPRTGDPVRVPARAVPVFKPSRLFKEEVAESTAEAEKAPEPPSFGEGGFGGGLGGGSGSSGGFGDYS